MESTNYAMIDRTKYESRSGVPPPSGMVTQRWRSCDMSTIRIPLNSRKYPGLYALIDEADYEMVSQYRWSIYKGGGSCYAYTTIDQKLLHLHRMIVNPPGHLFVDHINGDGLDNRRANLRPCTNSENQRNRRGVPSNNTSGYLGVSWFKRDQKWKAHIKHHGRKYHLGYFDEIMDAVSARDIAAMDLHGEFAKTNFPILADLTEG